MDAPRRRDSRQRQPGFKTAHYPVLDRFPLLKQNEKWFEHCVISALRQTTPCEVIVVVSPKTSQSNLEVLWRLRDTSKNPLLASCDGSDFPRALNIEFQTASADRIGMLRSDDCLDPRAVELCVRHNADIS